MDSDSIEKILNNLKIGSYLSNTLILICCLLTGNDESGTKGHIGGEAGGQWKVGFYQDLLTQMFLNEWVGRRAARFRRRRPCENSSRQASSYVVQTDQRLRGIYRILVMVHPITFLKCLPPSISSTGWAPDGPVEQTLWCVSLADLSQSLKHDSVK